MKASNFSEAQKAFIFKQAKKGDLVGDVCRKASISHVSSLRSCGAKGAFEGDLRNAGALRVSARARPAAQGGFRRELKESSQDLQRDRPAAAEPVAQGFYEGDAARGAMRRKAGERDLGHGRSSTIPSIGRRSPANAERQLATRWRLRALTVVDNWSRFSAVGGLIFRYRGEEVIANLDRVCGHVGFPDNMRVDQGGEFASRDLDQRNCRNDVPAGLSRPGVSTDHDFIEAFNGSCRRERSAVFWFLDVCRRSSND